MEVAGLGLLLARVSVRGRTCGGERGEERGEVEACSLCVLGSPPPTT